MRLSKKHYTADAAIVWCFDYRFVPALHALVRKNKIKRYDLICVAGGAQSLSSPEQASDRKFLLGQLQKSVKLHHAKRIILMTHADCGAYRGPARFGGNPAREKVSHRKEIESAKKAIRGAKELKSVPISGFFADFEKLNEF